MPFHKLSQWLAYSLIEPLEDAGITVTDLDQLTALAEYRNGGLLIDLGVLRPKHAAVLGEAHPGASEVVVEWRALTIALIDRLAERDSGEARPHAPRSCRSPRCWRAGPGPPGGGSPASSGRAAARRCSS